jgi:uncharacterized protein YcgL (UPF0745 family)
MDSENDSLYVKILELQMKKALLFSKINEVLNSLIVNNEDIEYEIRYVEPSQENINTLKENVEAIEGKLLTMLVILYIKKQERFSLIKEELENVKLIF